MDVFRLYRALPIDLQRLVARFLPVWERVGIAAPPQLPVVPEDRSYYKRIRRTPQGARRDPKHPNVLFYRLQKHNFRFCMYVRSNGPMKDFWVIKIEPQFVGAGFPALTLLQWDRLSHYTNRTIPPPPTASFINAVHTGTAWCLVFLTFSDRDTRLPTRQTMAQEFVAYVRRLSPVMHRYGKILAHNP